MDAKSVFVLGCLLVHAAVVNTQDTVTVADDIYDDEYPIPGEPTEDCVCVPFYLCPEGEVVTDGRNLIDPRRRNEEQELPIEEQSIPPACGPYHTCCRNPETTRTLPPEEHRCGIRNSNGINSRILTSQERGEAEFGEWPWQAAILRRDGEEYIFKCGGTLIDERHVLTVAHCAEKFLDNMANMVVRLGEWDTQVANEFLPHEDYGVEEIILHERYKSDNLFNDIAILRLSTDVEFKPNIDAICLPKDDDDFTGQDCVVTGWGTDAYESGAYSLIMKEVSVPVISNAECQNKLRETRLGKYFKLHGGFMCAGGKEGEDSCKGDGGGPLACYRGNSTYVLAGLVAWGIDCGQPGIPGVYVNVRKYINWIASKTNKPLQDYWE